MNVPLRLCRWYENHARDLPWRKTTDPYAIWVSEVMLQQTQVATVIPYYHRFLARFPDLATLAQAPEQDLLEHWAGLGYYSRARNLQKGARAIVELGEFPQTREALLRIPGIGPYTAGAILSIGFKKREALVDGNVVRVLSRFLGETREVEQTPVVRRFWQQCEAWVQRAPCPSQFNQGLMELGATLCTRGEPKCGPCPIRDGCVAHAKGIAHTLPRKKPKRPKVQLWWLGVIWKRGRRVYLKRNSKGEWWEGLYDFPRIEAGSEADLDRKLKRIARDWKPVEILGAQKHAVTHHRITSIPVVSSHTQTGMTGGDWFDWDEMERLPMSSLSRKLLRAYRA